jgi:integrase
MIWAELDGLDGEPPLWRIPLREGVNLTQEHVVPFAPQVVELPENLRPLTGSGELVFPGIRTAQRPISDGTLGAALKRMGCSGEQMVPHGFRSIASTLLNDEGWPPDVIEPQLSYIEGSTGQA